MVEISIPYPPSANRLWTRTRKGMRRSDSYNRWLDTAGWKLIGQKPKRITGRYKISILAVRPDNRIRDLDNILKPISDLLQTHKVIRNDSDCEMLCARWVTAGEGVTVRIEPAGVE